MQETMTTYAEATIGEATITLRKLNREYPYLVTVKYPDLPSQNTEHLDFADALVEFGKMVDDEVAQAIRDNA